MAETIRGINVVIGANTTALTSALSDVTKKSKDIQSELKQVERLLKLDPTNTQLLTQKQQLLASAVENTKTKLKALKAVQDQIKEQFQKGEISEGKYRAFQREIIVAENSLKKFESGMKSAKTTAVDVGNSIEKASLAIKAAITGIVVATGAAIGTAINTFADFEAQMDSVGAKADASAEQIEAMTDQAVELGAKTSFSATQAAAGMDELAAAGMNASQVMDAMPGVLSAAAASGEEMALVAETMASNLNAFGLEASQASHVADVLAKSANMSAVSVGDMGNSLKYAAPVANSLGYNLEEISAALVEMGNAGIKGEQAGTTLRGALIRLVDPPKEAAEELDRLNMSVIDSSGKMKPLATIIAELNTKMKGMTDAQKSAALASIFGTEAVSGMLVLVNKGPEAFEKYTQALINSGGAADEAAAKMRDNLRGSLDGLSGSAESLSITLMEKLEPSMRKIIDTASSGMDKITGFLNPPKQNYGSMDVQKGIRVEAKETGFDAINWEDIGQKAGEVIVKGLTKIGDVLGQVDWVSIGKDSATAMIGFVAGLVVALFNPVTWLNFIKDNWEVVLELFLTFAFMPAKWVKGIATALAKIPLAGRFLAWVVESMSKIGKKAIQPLKEFGESLLDGIAKGLGKGDKLFPILKKTVDDAIKSVKNKADNFRLAGMEFLEKIGQGFGSGLGKLRDKGIELANNIVDGLTQGIVKRIDNVKTAAGELAETIKNKIKSILHISSPSKVMEEFGGYVSLGLAQGIKKNKSKVEEQIEKVAQAVTTASQTMLNNLGRNTESSAAKFNLMRSRLGDTAAASENLKIDLAELNQNIQDNATRVEILAAAYQTAKAKLGETNEVTKDYAQQLAMAKIEQENLAATVINKQRAITAALKAEEEERLQNAQDSYNSRLEAANDAQAKEEEAARTTYENIKQYYDDQVTAAQKAYDARMAIAQTNRDDTVAMYQAQIDAIDEAEAEKSRAEEKANLESSIKNTRSKKAKTEAQKKLDEWLTKEQIRIQKEGLQTQIKQAEDRYDAEEKAAKSDLDRVKTNAETQVGIAQTAYNNQLALAKTHYSDAIKAAGAYYNTLGYQIDTATSKLKAQEATLQSVVSLFSQLGDFVGGNTGGGTNTGTQTQNPSYMYYTDNTDMLKYQNGKYYIRSDVFPDELKSTSWQQAFLDGGIPYITDSGWSWLALREAFETAGRTVSSPEGGAIKVYAKGTDYHSGGWAIAGEKGAELLNLPRGTQVLKASMTERLVNALSSLTSSGFANAAAGAAGGNVELKFNFTGPIHVRDAADITLISREIYSLAENAWRSKGQKR